MPQRPQTLADILQIINSNANAALNPPPTSSQILDVLVPIDETVGETDAAPTFAIPGPANNWNTPNWNLFAWA